MSWSAEISSPVAAPKLFKALVIDWHKLGPKVQPEIYANATCEPEEVGVGCVRQFNFTPDVPIGSIKEGIDALDKEKLEVTVSIVEGYDLGNTYESVKLHYKFEPTSDGGCICKVVSTCKTVHGAKIADEDLEAAKGGVISSIKAAEGYILANPHACA